MNIGRAIKELRKSKGLSQSELSNKVGITQAALSGIENGNKPNDQTMQKLCNALGVTESLIYVMGMEKTDVPQEKQDIYDQFFPVIQSLIERIATK